MAAHWLGAGYLLIPALVLVAGVMFLGMRAGQRQFVIVSRVAFVCYGTGLIAALFFPFPFPPYGPLPGQSFEELPRAWINVVPFATIAAAFDQGPQWPAARSIIANIVAFVPLGTFLGLFLERDRWTTVLAIAIAVGAVIEGAQFGLSLLMGFPYRVADVDDILLNVVGIALGYAAFRLGTRLLRAYAQRGWPGSDVARQIVARKDS